jgi:hypothetical protein
MRRHSLTLKTRNKRFSVRAPVDFKLQRFVILKIQPKFRSVLLTPMEIVGIVKFNCQLFYQLWESLPRAQVVKTKKMRIATKFKGRESLSKMISFQFSKWFNSSTVPANLLVSFNKNFTASQAPSKIWSTTAITQKTTISSLRISGVTQMIKKL